MASERPGLPAPPSPPPPPASETDNIILANACYYIVDKLKRGEQLIFSPLYLHHTGLILYISNFLTPLTILETQHFYIG